MRVFKTYKLATFPWPSSTVINMPQGAVLHEIFDTSSGLYVSAFVTPRKPNRCWAVFILDAFGGEDVQYLHLAGFFGDNPRMAVFIEERG